MSLGFRQSVYVTQLFQKNSKQGGLEILAVKVVYDVLLASKPELLRKVVSDVSCMYKIGTIVYFPGSFLFNGIRIKQDTDLSVCIDSEERLKGILPSSINRIRRKEFDEEESATEMSAYRS